MKKCVVISDSFKGTLSSRQICEIARQAIPGVFPGCEVVALPVADGGEGTVACFIEAVDAKPVTTRVKGPYGGRVNAAYARFGDKAVVEMSAAAGLPMVGKRKNPELTSTFGVGEMIRHAVENGCREILLGLGGSCTNDGGCGCAAALGVKFTDESGKSFVPVGGTLDKIADIDLTDAKELLSGVKLVAMCDVENPLYGENGAAYVFAPQKGANKAQVQRLDAKLRALDEAFRRSLGVSVADIPGSGAAGGMGGGCIALLGMELRSGIESVLDMMDFDARLEGAELVITGEGRIDSQSVQGKVISGVAKRTRAKGLPLIAIAGCIDDSASAVYDIGVTAMFGTDRAAQPFKECAKNSELFYRRTLEDVLYLIRAFERRA